MVSTDATRSSQFATSSYLSKESTWVPCQSGPGKSSTLSCRALPFLAGDPFRIVDTRGALAGRGADSGLAEVEARSRFLTPSSDLGCLAQ